jgi:hypothetical protein
VKQGIFPRGKTLLVVLVLAAAVATFIVALGRRDDSSKPSCAAQTFEGLVDSDRSAQETLDLFVAEHEEGPIPLTGWTVTSDNADTTTYTSNDQGHWQIVIRKGQVRSYNGCP